MAPSQTFPSSSRPRGQREEPDSLAPAGENRLGDRVGSLLGRCHARGDVSIRGPRRRPLRSAQSSQRLQASRTRPGESASPLPNDRGGGGGGGGSSSEDAEHPRGIRFGASSSSHEGPSKPAEGLKDSSHPRHHGPGSATGIVERHPPKPDRTPGSPKRPPRDSQAVCATFRKVPSHLSAPLRAAWSPASIPCPLSFAPEGPPDQPSPDPSRPLIQIRRLPKPGLKHPRMPP